MEITPCQHRDMLVSVPERWRKGDEEEVTEEMFFVWITHLNTLWRVHFHLWPKTAEAVVTTAVAAAAPEAALYASIRLTLLPRNEALMITTLKSPDLN